MENQSKLGKMLPILNNENVDYKKEFIAGLTTFLTMAYIIAVNPAILSATGMPAGPLVTATCLTAAFATILMGCFANLPFALASGMGLNAFFAYTVVLQEGISVKVALAAVFVEGIIFIILSLFKVREAVVNAIPLNMKLAVTGGIGCFIALIGFINSGLIVNNEATLISMGSFSPTVIVMLVGLIIIAVLDKKNIRGAILWGILVSSVLAWAYGIISPEKAAELGIFLPNGIFKFENPTEIMGQLDFSYLTSSDTIWKFVTILFTFLFVDFFDTVGTLVGVTSKANMLDENGNVPNAGRALLVDAVATTAGAVCGVSTVTTYVESSTGVAAGGKTGYTSVFTGILFLIAMFLSPIFVAIPGCATAPALIYVGYLMLSAVKGIDFDDITEALPAFLTIVLMAFTYSIGDGLTIGILSYVIINVIYNIFFAPKNEKKKISWVMIILGLIFIIKIILIH